MVLGMSLATFTLIHVLISVIGIGSGVAVALGLISGRRLDGLTALFLGTTILTSVTGYAFPFKGLLPSHILGALSLVVLAIALVARYSRHLEGRWRSAYVISAIFALYFNVFVLVVQSFEKVPALRALAPTQQEPPFAITQLIVLVAFIVLGVLAVRGFRSAELPASAKLAA